MLAATADLQRDVEKLVRGTGRTLQSPLSALHSYSSSMHHLVGFRLIAVTLCALNKRPLLNCLVRKSRILETQKFKPLTS